MFNPGDRVILDAPAAVPPDSVVPLVSVTVDGDPMPFDTAGIFQIEYVRLGKTYTMTFQAFQIPQQFPVEANPHGRVMTADSESAVVAFDDGFNVTVAQASLTAE